MSFDELALYDQTCLKLREIFAGQLPEDVNVETTTTAYAYWVCTIVRRHHADWEATIYDYAECAVRDAVQESEAEQRELDRLLAALRTTRATGKLLDIGAGWGRLSGVCDALGAIDELGANILRELDYQNEAYNTRRIAFNMQSIPGVHLAKIYSQYTTSKVMTEEFIQGVRLNKVEQIDAAGLDRKQLARTFIRAIMKQVLVDGFFHGDPHPGNLMIDLDTGVIQFLDLGMVGELDLQQRISLGDLLFSLQNRDPDGLASALLGVSVPFRAAVNRVAFKKDIEHVISRYLIYADVGASLSEVLSAVTKSLSDNGLCLNPNMTLALKVIVQVKEVMRTLNPEESMIFSAIEEAQVVLRQEITLEKIGDLAKKEATNFMREAMKRLPELQGATIKWLDNYQKGRFEVFVDTSDLGQHIDRFNVSTERLMLGMILTGMLIGGAIVLAVPAATIVGEYIQLAVLLIFVLAAGIGLWLVYRILWRGFRKERALNEHNPWKS